VVIEGVVGGAKIMVVFTFLWGVLAS